MQIDCLKDIGKLIARLRFDAGMKGTELADKINSTQSHISRIESGKVNISITTLLRIARAFGFRVHINIRKTGGREDG